MLAEIVSELGVPTTVEDAYRTYMGKRLSEVIEAIERVIGRKLPADFADAYQARTFDAFRARLKPVVGARNFSRPGARCRSASPPRRRPSDWR